MLSGAYAVLNGLGLFLAVAETWEGLVGCGTGVVLGPREAAKAAESNTLSPYSYLTAV